MSSGMMDTDRGGESTQYESIKTVTEPTSKQAGQTGSQQLNPEERNELLESQQSQETAERGAKTAENVRYGQNISEQGMGGKTTEAEGTANQDGAFGSVQAQDNSVSAEETREAQGYGGGSGVGG